MVRRSVLVAGVVLAVFVVVTQWGLWLWFVSPGEYDHVTVTVSDENGTCLATVHARVADTGTKRMVGLSETHSIAPDEGMLFVHEASDTHEYVMRAMDFPLDIVFVSANGTVTAVRHASTPPPLTPESLLARYGGRGKYVLEVNRGWANRTGVGPGDRLSVPGLIEGGTGGNASGARNDAAAGEATPTGAAPGVTPTGTTPAATATGAAPAATPTPGADRAWVTAVDANGTRLAALAVRLSETPDERYTGLSDTADLPWDEGMLFVYDEPGDHAYVMREMDFPLDIVYLASDGTVTRIHHAPLPPPNHTTLHRYRGHGQFVLEVNRGWTNATGLDEGDRVELPLALG